MRSTFFGRTVAAVCGLLLTAAWAAAASAAEFLVVANDNKVVLVDGKVTVVDKPPSDTVSIIDIG